LKNYIAVDIGASSGRLMLGQLVDQKLELKELHRFSNGFIKENGHDRWDIDRLIDEIFKGLEIAKKQGIENAVLGIDTWAVDYVLIGDDGRKLQDPCSYRDSRTANSIQELTSEYSKEYIYKKTGIQFLDFNTLYQLYEEDNELLDKTDRIMMIPDYIGYVLTGNAVTEVTNASTTQMMNLRQGLFDDDLLKKVNVTDDQFQKLVDAGTKLGKLSHKWYRQYDIPKCEVVTTTTHDTASAVVGTPGKGDDWAFLSSGTWSLLGRELDVPENGEEAFKENYTNEWGAYGTYRFLKNIMGLWIIQSIRKEQNNKFSFAEMAEAAEKVEPFQQFIDINDERFKNPSSMIDEIKAYCQETKQKVPDTTGELVNTVYSNLALFYANELQKLARITKKPINVLNIVGGGSNVAFLNQLTSDLASVRVEAGPGEATAIGNILVQMIALGDIKNVSAARSIVSASNGIRHFVPRENYYGEVLEAYQNYINRKSEGTGE